MSLLSRGLAPRPVTSACGELAPNKQNQTKPGVQHTGQSAALVSGPLPALASQAPSVVLRVAAVGILDMREGFPRGADPRAGGCYSQVDGPVPVALHLLPEPRGGAVPGAPTTGPDGSPPPLFAVCDGEKGTVLPAWLTSLLIALGMLLALGLVLLLCRR